MPFMGWSAEKRKGQWYAVKQLADDGFSSVRVTHVHHKLKLLGPTATREDAEREIKKLYVRKVLK